MSDPWAEFTPAPAAAPSAPLRLTVRPGDANQSQSSADSWAEFTPVASPTQQLATGFMNQGSAAGQGTTPDIGAQTPNLISADTYQNDAGEVLFRDPMTGELKPTDQNKHVALRDPSDNKVKVFARTADTNEGRLSSAGRLLMTGMGSSAPTARPAIPLPGAKAPSPSIEQLKAAGAAGYKSPEVVGLEVKSPALASFAEKLQADLNAAGIDENLAPKTFGILAKASKAPPDSLVTGQNLESLRRMFGNAAGSIDKTERAAGMMAKDALGQFMETVPQADVLAGNAEEAGQTIKTANANFSAGMRAEMLDKKQVRAELRAAAANSGRNVSNTMRQRLADVLLNPKEHRGWSEGELQAAEKIVRGSRTENAIRLLGNLLGGGGGLGAIVTGGVGAYATGGPGAVAPVIGYGLKSISNALTMRQIGKLSEAIRSRAPLAKQISAPLEDWSKATQAYEQIKSPRTLSMLAITARNLVNNLKDAGVSIRPAELLKSLSLQGPMPTRADEKQQ